MRTITRPEHELSQKIRLSRNFTTTLILQQSHRPAAGSQGRTNDWRQAAVFLVERRATGTTAGLFDHRTSSRGQEICPPQTTNLAAFRIPLNSRPARGQHMQALPSSSKGGTREAVSVNSAKPVPRRRKHLVGSVNRLLVPNAHRSPVPSTNVYRVGVAVQPVSLLHVHEKASDPELTPRAN